MPLQGCDDPDEPDHARVELNRRAASGWVDANGCSLEVDGVPVLPFIGEGADRCAVPCANHYVGNGFVLVPTGGHPADRDMLDLIASHHPGRDTIGLDVGAILARGGGIHCITQQVPA